MAPEQKPTILFDDFAKIDLRVAKVIEAQEHPNADKLLVLKLDLGSLGERTICAGVRKYYAAQDLVGKSIIVVANLAPRAMRGIESQGMLLAASTGDPITDVIVLGLDRAAEPGSTVS